MGGPTVRQKRNVNFIGHRIKLQAAARNIGRMGVGRNQLEVLQVLWGERSYRNLPSKHPKHDKRAWRKQNINGSLTSADVDVRMIGGDG
ncbi:hypothetical protein M0804_003130 [Polistes exclamans]|nr:hypothetical protein M0804_003130 [Polistes exclamans]